MNYLNFQVKNTAVGPLEGPSLQNQQQNQQQQQKTDGKEESSANKDFMFTIVR